MLSRVPSLLALVVFVSGCADPFGPAGPRDRAPGADGGTTDPSRPTETDLPCDVAQVLADRCWTCHGATPAGGAPMSLVTLSDLSHASAADPTASYAERSVVRMRQATLPMPPVGGPVPEAEIATLEAWITAGMPGGTCTVSDPYDTPLTCTSMSMWTRGDAESPNMRPGGTCVSCHDARARERRLWLGGTVYPSAHEPDDCSGADTAGAATIEITDAEGRVFTLAPNSAGNFFLMRPTSEDVEPGGAIANAFTFPYTARVLLDGRERVMATAQTSGECNGCHTVDGAMGAPGRVMLP